MNQFRSGTRYLRDGWRELRLRSGLSDEQVMQRSLILFERACEQGIGERTVFRYRLDNPFMHEHARATVAAQARKDLASRNHAV